MIRMMLNKFPLTASKTKGKWIFREGHTSKIPSLFSKNENNDEQSMTDINISSSK
jgi:hypothetical protein